MLTSYCILFVLYVCNLETDMQVRILLHFPVYMTTDSFHFKVLFIQKTQDIHLKQRLYGQQFVVT